MPIARAIFRESKMPLMWTKDNFALNSFQQYNLSYIQNGEWLDYTRQLSNNVTYAVYCPHGGIWRQPRRCCWNGRLSPPGQPRRTSRARPSAPLSSPQTGGVQD